MKINYRVIHVDEKEHTIGVRYYTDKITEDMLSSHVYADGSIDRNEDGYPRYCRTDYYFNVFEIPTPSPERIIEIIESGAPKDWLYMQEQILDPNVDTSLAVVEQIKNIEGSFIAEVPTRDPIITE